MVLSAVPDFFQEETTDALRAQVDWLVREVGGGPPVIVGRGGVYAVGEQGASHAVDLSQGAHRPG